MRLPSQSYKILLPLLMLAVLLTGCASQSTKAHAPHVTPTATDFPTATPNPETIPISFQQAWGNAHYWQLPTALPGDHVFVSQNALTSDGQWLVGTEEPHDFLDNKTLPDYLILYNVKTRQIRQLRQLLHPQSQILQASLDGDWLAWSEADDQPNFFDWTLFVYNLQTGVTRQIAQAVRVNGQPVPGPSAMPSVSHNHLVWGQVVGSAKPDTISNTVVRMDDLTTGQVTTLATKAGDPTLSWPWVFWDQIGTTNDQGYVTIKNLETGHAEQLNAKPASLSVLGKSLVYDDISDAYLIDDFTKGTTNVEILTSSTNEDDHIQFVTLNNRLVGWVRDLTTQVYDRAEQRIVTLPVKNGLSDSTIVGNLLIWPEPEPQAQQTYDSQHDYTPTPMLNILDTTTLPVLNQ